MGKYIYTYIYVLEIVSLANSRRGHVNPKGEQRSLRAVFGDNHGLARQFGPVKCSPGNVMTLFAAGRLYSRLLVKFCFTFTVFKLSETLD